MINNSQSNIWADSVKENLPKVINNSVPFLLKMAGDLSKDILSKSRNKKSLKLEEIQDYLDQQSRMNLEISELIQKQSIKLKNHTNLIYITLGLNLISISALIYVIIYFR